MKVSLRELLDSKLSSSAKSTIVGPILIAMSILVSGIVGLVAFGRTPPGWLLAVMAFFLFICLGLFCFIFVFFALKDPDRLHPEKLKIMQLAIEHGLMGDTKRGFKRLEKTRDLEATEPVKRIGSRPETDANG